MSMYEQGTPLLQILASTGISKTSLYRKLCKAEAARDRNSTRALSSKTAARHRRLHRARGPASLHHCVRHLEAGLHKQAFDWAQLHTEDGMDVWADYVPLCRSCHIRYDADARPITPEHQARRSAAMRRSWAERTESERAYWKLAAQLRQRDPETGRFLPEL